MSGKDERRRRILSKDERALWSRFTKAIDPLPDKPQAVDRPDSDEAVVVVPQPAPPRRPKAPASVREPPAKTPPPLSPLGRRMKQRVARGHESIDARLDLHGLTQKEAHAALNRFLRQASAGKARMALVITGKSGVLRQHVPQWLALPNLRALVIGFEPAHGSHSGQGALYVRVRQAR